MKVKKIALTCFSLFTGTTTGLALINQYIKVKAKAKQEQTKTTASCFHWRHGNINYAKTGTGKPLLFVHDLKVTSSSYDWHRITSLFSQNYTVYVLDLLGFGYSDKPNITYTNYLYVQLISDFIKSEIGKRTDIITSGDSASIPLMACANNPDLFDEMIFINPPDIADYSQIPGKSARLFKWFIECPIIGTLTYNIAVSRRNIAEEYSKKTFAACKAACNQNLLECSYVSAHIGDSPKSVYASIRCHYTKCNLIHALKQINNSLYIIGGEDIENIKERLQTYQTYNSSIESVILPKTKELPQLEAPERLYHLIQTYLR